jgi:hypothetical protein
VFILACLSKSKTNYDPASIGERVRVRGQLQAMKKFSPHHYLLPPPSRLGQINHCSLIF